MPARRLVTRQPKDPLIGRHPLQYVRAGVLDISSRATTGAVALRCCTPDRVAGLVSVDGYNIQDIAERATPITPEDERRLWYQYYLHGDQLCGYGFTRPL